MMLKKILFYAFNLFWMYLSRLVPKNESLWVFGCWFGKRYSDNSRYLYEYIKCNHPDIRAIWLTDCDDVFEKLRNQEFEVYKRNSIHAYLISLRASVSVYVQSNLFDCLPFLNDGKTKLIQLWHGIPLKKIGFSDDREVISEGYLKKLKNKIFIFLNEKHDLMIACSAEDKANFEKAFSVEKILITGYPRNDCLIKEKEKEKESGKEKKIKISYLPTFRSAIGERVDFLIPYEFDIEAWEKALEGKGELYIKMHPVNLPSNNMIEKIKNCKNINILEDCDVVDLLKETDILITDFSSVYFDFLLTGKPIIFSPFDFDEYIKNDRGLYYRYNDVTPGPKCGNWHEVMFWVNEFYENSNIFSEERIEIRDKFHLYDDGKSCERVFYEIKKILK